jgi:hypothetical protein
MKFAVVLFLSFLLHLASFANAQSPVSSDSAAPAGGRREVNVTSDSLPGWIPSEEQETLALTAMNDYFSAMDNEKYTQAFGMMTEIMRQSLPEDEFLDYKRAFHAQAGPLKDRQIVKVTWTRDSANAPLPGVYAAVDVASHFANIDRHCGFVVLYQKPSGGSFEIMREESNFIGNSQAKDIVAKKSQAALDNIWATMATNCPNYADTGAAR